MHRISARLLALASTAALALTAASHPYALATAAHADPSARSRVAAPVKVPGSLDGLGFDTCHAPKQTTMDAWRTESPYWGVGVYIGGQNRACSQPNLTRNWVVRQHDAGWNVFPIWVDLQAPRVGGHIGPCVAHPFTGTTMSPSNATARGQGAKAADRAIARARDLGVAKGSTLFLDMESYENDLSECNQPVQNFQSGWSKRLHAQGWKSGYYSSRDTGILALDYVRTTFPGTYEMPDAIWFAADNGRQDVDAGAAVKNSHWRGQRVHQYNLDVDRTYGGVQLHVDENAIVIGQGAVPGRPQHTCGVRLDFDRYQTWQRGDRSDQVKAAQCLLKQKGLFTAAMTGQFNLATARAVGQWQDRAGIPATRSLDRATWTTLFSSGATPLLKRGSAGDRVRFLQRALTAALAKPVQINGVFGRPTTAAVSAYQDKVGLPGNGIVDTATWNALQSPQP